MKQICLMSHTIDHGQCYQHTFTLQRISRKFSSKQSKKVLTALLQLELVLLWLRLNGRLI